MNDPLLDRLARRLAAGDDVSRRRFLVGSAAAAAATALPLRLPGLAFAAGVTSCDCQGYSDRAYLDCWNEIVDTGGPYNDEFGATATIQFSIANRFATYACDPSAQKAMQDCQQVPCPAGQICVIPKPFSAPACQDNCQNQCTSSQTCCDGNCVSLQTDSENCGRCGHACIGGSVCENGHCGPAKCSPTCTGGQSCCPVTPGSSEFLCTDTKTDNFNCNACGNVCPSNMSCCGGKCTDPGTDNNNCGGCGIVCPTGEQCCGGSCGQPCAAGEVCCQGAFAFESCNAPVCCGCGLPAECCTVNGAPTCCPNGCHTAIDGTMTCV